MASRSFAAAATFLLAGCAAQLDQMVLTAAPGQKEILRDGVPSLISEKRHVVMLRPASQHQVRSGRPKLVVAVLNRGKEPVTVRVSDIRAADRVAKNAAIRIYQHQELAAEVEAKKNAALTLAVIGGVAGALSASQAGYSHTTGSVYGAGYTGSYSSTTYSAAAAQYAADRNAAVTGSNIAAIQESGEVQLAQLQDTILKDHTVMPGEWHGGMIVLDPPMKSEKGAEYTVELSIDGETHAFEVGQREI